MEIDHISTIQFFNTRIWQQSRQQITNERLQLFYLLNGDVFYSIQTWPTDIQQLFWNFQTFIVFHWQWLFTRSYIKMDLNVTALGITYQRRKESEAN